MADTPIRVLIVDDHPMVRDGLKAYLDISPVLECVGAVSSGEEAIKACETAAPDVILMDMIMPVMDGPAATRAILEQHPRIKVIALTSYHDADLVQRAITAGASGYLLKSVSMSDLTSAIQSVQTGQAVLAPEAAQALVQVTRRESKVLEHDLTQRERETLALLVQGLTNQEIAEKLKISQFTARFHVSNILTKLGADNRTDAVRLALAQGLV